MATIRKQLYSPSGKRPNRQRLSTKGKNSSVVGVVVSVLILAAIASVGYYQFEVAPNQATTTTTQAPPSCTPSTCVNVTLLVGADGCSPAPCGYSPANIAIVIGHNNTVIWKNADRALHTVTSTSVPPGAAGFNKASMSKGDSLEVTFTSPGTYSYICSYHPWMLGTVTVKSG